MIYSIKKSLNSIILFIFTLNRKNNGNWTESRLDCNIKWKKLLNKEELIHIPAEEGLKLIQLKGEVL